jgi:hypothetical protein
VGRLAGIVALYLAALPWNVTVCWPLVLLAHAVGGAPGRLRWERPPDKVGPWCLWTSLEKGSLPLRLLAKAAPVGKGKAPKGITLGHGGVYKHGYDDDLATPDVDEWTSMEAHENVHVEQVEVVCILMLAVALVLFATGGSLSTALFVWWVAWPAYVGANTVEALLRGGHGYRDAPHEKAARNRGQ